MASGSYGFWDGWSVLWTEPGSDDLGPGANFNPDRGVEVGAPEGRSELEFNWRAFMYPSVPYWSAPGDPRVQATDFGVDAGRVGVGKLGLGTAGVLTAAGVVAAAVVLGPSLVELLKRKVAR